MRDLKRALELDNEDETIMLSLAEALIREGKNKEALDYIKSAVEINSEVIDYISGSDIYDPLRDNERLIDWLNSSVE